MENKKTDVPSDSRLQRILIAYAILATAICILFSSYLYDKNLDLQDGISQRDVFIASIQKGDSAYTSAVKSYSETITKYVDNCNLTVDGKEISTENLVKLINEISDENAVLKDSLIDCRRISAKNILYKEHYDKKVKPMIDSLFITSTIVALTKKKYGISYKVERVQDEYVFVRKESMADSAIALFPFYRDKIKRDTAANTWLIKTTKNTIDQAHNKKKTRQERKLKR